MNFVLKYECGLKNWAYIMCRRETESQRGGGHFPTILGGQSLVKAILLIGDKVVGKAIANRTCTSSDGKLEVWGLAPRKNFSGHAL